MNRFPTIGAIASWQDVKTALENIRSFFSPSANSQAVQVGTVAVKQPPNGSTLDIKDGQLLQVDNKWELMGEKTGLSGLSLQTTKCLMVKVDGVFIKLAIVQ